jgi:hypothetical protein
MATATLACQACVVVSTYFIVFFLHLLVCAGVVLGDNADNLRHRLAGEATAHDLRINLAADIAAAVVPVLNLKDVLRNTALCLSCLVECFVRVHIVSFGCSLSLPTLIIYHKRLLLSTTILIIFYLIKTPEIARPGQWARRSAKNPALFKKQRRRVFLFVG